jgi:hypothetical protein
MLLSVQRLVASEYGHDIKVPTELDATRSTESKKGELAHLSNMVLLSTRYMSQRSVALDPRWKSEWIVLRAKVDRMEALLLDMC